MDDLEYIRRFSNITICKVCKELNIESKNAYRQKEDVLHKIRCKIESEIAKLYIKE